MPRLLGVMNALSCLSRTGIDSIITIAFLSVTACAMSTTTVQTFDAIQDNNFLDGSGFNTGSGDNYGAANGFNVGRGTSGIWRGAVSFTDQTGGGLVRQNSDLLLIRATLRMEINVPLLNYIPCTSVESIGCLTVHALLNSWGEGDGNSRTAVTGESSWVHNSFPEVWSSPGGDFSDFPLGQMFPPPTDLPPSRVNIVEISLDVERMRELVYGNVDFFGFLLRDDDNPGAVRFWSREQAASFSAVPPQLELVFERLSSPSPTDTPTGIPTEIPTGSPVVVTPAPTELRATMSPTSNPSRTPTRSPVAITSAPAGVPIPATRSPIDATMEPTAITRGTDAPVSTTAAPSSEAMPVILASFKPSSTGEESTTLAPGAGTNTPTQFPPLGEAGGAETCGDFQQSVALESRLDATGLNRFRIVMEDELKMLTPVYIRNGADVITNVFVLPIEQQQLPNTTVVEVAITYRICYQVPLNSENANLVESFTTQYVAYISVDVNRDNLEERFLESGIMVIPGSLSVAALVDASASFIVDDGKRINVAAIVGGVAGGLVLFIALAVLWFRFRRNRSPIDKDENSPSQQLRVQWSNSGSNETEPNQHNASHFATTPSVSARPQAAAVQQADGTVPMAVAAWPQNELITSVNLPYKAQGEDLAQERTVNVTARPIFDQLSGGGSSNMPTNLEPSASLPRRPGSSEARFSATMDVESTTF